MPASATATERRISTHSIPSDGACSTSTVGATRWRKPSNQLRSEPNVIALPTPSRPTRALPAARIFSGQVIEPGLSCTWCHCSGVPRNSPWKVMYTARNM